MSLRPKQRFKHKIGQVFWLPAKVRMGMFPSERYFYMEIGTGPVIAGYVLKEQIENDKIRAVLLDLEDNDALLAIPGELSRNIFRIPITLVAQYASA